MNDDILRLDDQIEYMKGVLIFGKDQSISDPIKDRSQLSIDLKSTIHDHIRQVTQALACSEQLASAGMADDEHRVAIRAYVLSYRLGLARHGMTGRLLHAEMCDIGMLVDRLEVDVQSRYPYVSLVAVREAYYRARFYVRAYEDLERGSQEGKIAFDNAIAYLDTVSEEHYISVTKVMQRIRDDLLLWIEYYKRLEDL